MSIILANHGIISTANAPTTVAFTWASNGDTNGIFYYFEAYNYQTLWSQAQNNIELYSDTNVSGSNAYSNAVDRNNTTAWVTTSTNGGEWTFNFVCPGRGSPFPNRTFRANRITMRSRSTTYDLTTYMGANCLLQAKVDRYDGWTTIYTFSPSAAVGAWWDSGIFTNDNYYGYYRIYSPRNGVHAMGEIEVYGELRL